jgi:hypothetical protein
MDIGPEVKPQGVGFVGAAKMRIGSVIYTIISDEAVRYLRRDKMMREFVKNYGGTTSAMPRTCQLIVEFVPIDFQPDDQDALRRIKEASGMPTASVCEA